MALRSGGPTTARVNNLWANRYRAVTAAWGSPINIEASNTDIDDFDLAVDASGNAVVAWHEVPADPRAFEAAW